MWSGDHLLEIAVESLREAERRCALEQTHRGVDGFEEVELHPVLEGGFAAAGLGVLREEPYPAEWRVKQAHRRALPGDAERQRCDLVLTPRRGQRLADGLDAQRAAEARRAAAKGTLFEPVEQAEPAPRAPGIDPGDAMWLELKVVGQYCYTGGVPGPNAQYASEITRGVTGDVRKLRDDPAILHAAAMLVLFTVDAAVGQHDLAVLAHRCLDHDLPIRTPTTARLAIPDRIGNGCCTVWLAEVAKT